jgi:hypothetical protein
MDGFKFILSHVAAIKGIQKCVVHTLIAPLILILTRNTGSIESIPTQPCKILHPPSSCGDLLRISVAKRSGFDRGARNLTIHKGYNHSA